MDLVEAFDRERHPYRRTLLQMPLFVAFLAVVLALAAGDLSMVRWLFPLKLVEYTPIMLGLTWLTARRRRTVPSTRPPS